MFGRGGGNRLIEPVTVGPIVFWDDLFDKWGVKVYIHDTKCGQTRYCRLVNATPHLLLWKNSYPGGSPEEDARVFIARDRREIIDITFDRTLKRAAKLAGITKRVYPHLFQKSRATHMVAKGYQESVIKASLWGNQDTEMFRTYVHPAEREIDAEFLAKASLVVKEETQSDALKFIVCARCHLRNVPTLITVRSLGSHCGRRAQLRLI